VGDLLLSRLNGRVKIVLTNAVVDGETGDVNLVVEPYNGFFRAMSPLVIHRVPGIGSALFIQWTLFDAELERLWSTTPALLWRHRHQWSPT